ncbi:lysine-sensitive aspartokinase 3 [Candidatus Tachikawaea gelatinosa]|uniref:Aspartokinase n=1 Tax=Candidatus Tachikawaea gelatinosa TaxID=1410383 RepID=A0A090AMM1_9ENTR|nr:lysine-sensitive aspartokinase 3 [Candidatus Tachikawaea gelatinosa]BAP58844.1 aspartokinase [Candidatus Tachikawaea gelatinosa]
MSKNLSLIVAKFGGTSVADFHSMNCSIDIINANKNIRLVILSASAGVTNLLINLSNEKKINQRSLLIEKIRYIQYSIINQLKNKEKIYQKVNSILKNIIDLSNNKKISKTSFLKDELIAYGELLSTHIFIEILHERQIHAEWFDIRKVLKTNDNFGQAEPDCQLIFKNAQKFLTPIIKNKLVITQGFIGSEKNGKTTLLGRGGSDYTASLLGEALLAKRIDIWTDVPGIYTTDPKIVHKAKKIKEITFEEAAEMAIFGAKILHPATLLPAIRNNIPVFVGSSKKPKKGGTIIRQYSDNPPLFRAIVLRCNQILLTLHSVKMLHTCGFLAKVFNILKQYKISVDLITTSEVSIALTLDIQNTLFEETNLLNKYLLKDLSKICHLKIEKNLSLITLIGNNLSKSYGIGKEVFGILEDYHLRLICYGASNHNICFLISKKDEEKIIKILHKNLFE